MKKILLLVAACLTFASVGTSAWAADEKSVSHSESMHGIEHVEISNSVGTITLIQDNNSDSLMVNATLEGKKSGWFRGNKDVDNLDITLTRRGNRLVIEFNEDKVNADMEIRMPAPEQLTISLGVGTIEGELGDSNVVISLGVGDVNMSAAKSSAGRIEMNTGVGDASVSGATQASHQRAMVTASVEANGDGARSIEVSVGVGDAKIALK
ncbi:hypothetical protein [Aliidiomarina celeris]|uniref:hypothetical protein n=1 Tax=Aliidiomarina celeris TaxID=2249428 RepID=UPI000DE8E529|nr:hypothetical protein [Aliidiomarina celeris]